LPGLSSSRAERDLNTRTTSAPAHAPAGEPNSQERYPEDLHHDSSRRHGSVFPGLSSASFKTGLGCLATPLILLLWLADVEQIEAQTTTVLSGSFEGSGTKNCSGSTSPFAISGTITITLQPALASLATTGGQVTGTIGLSGTASACGVNSSGMESGSVTGVVNPGGQTTLTFANVNDGSDVFCSFTGSGTINNITGTIPSSCFSNNGSTVAQGSFEAASSPAQTATVLSGPYAASGTKTCGTSTIPYAGSGTVTITLQPVLSSLVASGGQVTGTIGLSGTESTCGMDSPTMGSGSVSGVVNPGGQTMLTFSVEGDSDIPCSFTGAGTSNDITGIIPSSCSHGSIMSQGSFEATSAQPTPQFQIQQSSILLQTQSNVQQLIHATIQATTT